jgi:hypothetical protein
VCGWNREGPEGSSDGWGEGEWEGEGEGEGRRGVCNKWSQSPHHSSPTFYSTMAHCALQPPYRILYMSNPALSLRKEIPIFIFLSNNM